MHYQLIRGTGYFISTDLEAANALQVGFMAHRYRLQQPGCGEKRKPISMKLRSSIMRKAITNWLPLNSTVRKAKRRITGYNADPQNLSLTVQQYPSVKGALAEAGMEISGATVLEIGSGWLPIVPILLLRDGAKKIVMTDLNKHLDESSFRATAEYLKTRFPGDIFIQNIQSMDELPLEYLAPFSVTQLDDSSVDIVVSRTVLEHIPPHDLFELFSSLRDKLKPGAVMAHLVDHSDHYEHSDKSISKINFLTWSEEKHALINYISGTGENRLRHHEYYPLFHHAGYELLREFFHVDESTMQVLPRLDLKYPYCAMNPSQLATMTSIYILRKAETTRSLEQTLERINRTPITWDRIE